MFLLCICNMSNYAQLCELAAKLLNCVIAINFMHAFLTELLV